MDRFAYPAQFTPDDGGSHMVRFRDLPEAITSGCDMADAVEQAADCLQEALAGRLARRDAVPRSRCISLQNWRCLRQWKEPG
jgi:antitoxin HicB